MRRLFIWFLFLVFLALPGIVLAESKSFFDRSTGDGAVTETLTATGQWGIRSVRFHMSSAGGVAENFVVTLDSGTNARHDAVLLTQDMTTVHDLVWGPGEDGVIWFESTDSVNVAYANTNARKWGLEIEWVSR